MISKKEFIDWFERNVTIDSVEIMEYWDFFKGEHKLATILSPAGLKVLEYMQTYPADEIFSAKRIRAALEDYNIGQINGALTKLVSSGYVERKFIEKNTYYELTKRGQEINIQKGVF